MSDEQAKAQARKEADQKRRAEMRAMMRSRRAAGEGGSAEVSVAGGGADAAPSAAAVSVAVAATPSPNQSPAGAVTAGGAARTPTVVGGAGSAARVTSAPRSSPPLTVRGVDDVISVRSRAHEASKRTISTLAPGCTVQVDQAREGDVGAALARAVEAIAASLADAETERRESLGGAGDAPPGAAEEVVRQLRTQVDQGQSLFSAAELLESSPSFSEKDADKLRFTAYKRGVEATQAAEAALAEARKAVSDEEVVQKSMAELHTFATGALAESAATVRKTAQFPVPAGEEDPLGVAQALLAAHKSARESAAGADSELAQSETTLAAARERYQKVEAMRAQRDAQRQKLAQRRQDVDAELESLKIQAEAKVAEATENSTQYRSGVEQELQRLRSRLASAEAEADRLKKLKATLDRDNREVHAVFEEIVKVHQGLVDGGPES